MAWEHRGGMGRYYTRSHTKNGHVIREYVGTGPAAEQIAAQDAQRRTEREALATELREETAQWKLLDGMVTAVSEDIRFLSDVVLYASGCYHARKGWRKRHGTT